MTLALICPYLGRPNLRGAKCQMPNAKCQPAISESLTPTPRI